MQAIDKVLKDLASQESPNYGTTVKKYSINCTSLLRRYRGLAYSQAVNVVNIKSLLTPLSNYSTCCTNRIYAFGTPTTRLRV